MRGRRGDPQRAGRRPGRGRRGRRVGRRARRGRCTPTSPSSRPRTRPAWPPTAARRPSVLADAGALGPRFTRRPRHPPRPTPTSTLLGGAGSCCLCPTTERDLADGIGPAARAARRRGAAGARQRLARGDRPVRGGAGGGARRAAGDRRARPPPRRRPAARRPPRGGHAALGWPDGGRLDAGRARRLRHRRRSTRCGWPARPPSTRVDARRVRGHRRRRHHVVVGGDASCATAPRSASTSPPSWRRDRALRDEHAGRSTTSACWSPTTRALGDGPLGIVRDAALVVDGDRVVAVERRRGAVGRRAPRRRRALRDPGLRRQPHAPGVRRRPGRRVRRAHGRRAVRGRRHPRRRPPPPAPPATERARRRSPRARRREALRGRDHARRDQVRLRARRRRRGALPARSPRALTDDVTFLGAHVVPGRVRRAAPTTTSSSCATDMLAACAPHARWIDVVLRARRLRRRPVRAPCSAPAARPGSGCACTPTSSARARACSSPSSWAPRRPTTAPTSTDADVEALAASDDRRDVPAGDRLLHPPALPRRAAACSTPAPRSRWRPTATRARATRPRCRSASRSPSATCA